MSGGDGASNQRLEVVDMGDAFVGLLVDAIVPWVKANLPVFLIMAAFFIVFSLFAQRRIREMREGVEEKLSKQRDDARNESRKLLDAIRDEHEFAFKMIRDEAEKLSERIRTLESRVEKNQARLDYLENEFLKPGPSNNNSPIANINLTIAGLQQQHQNNTMGDKNLERMKSDGKHCR